MITESQARELIGVDGATVLIEIVAGAWRAHLAEGVRRSPTTRANVVWDYMVKGADEFFAPMDGVTRTEVYGRPVYVVRGQMAVRFKKHDADLLTSNVQTLAQQDLAVQGSFDAIPDVPHVSCGYVLDAADADIRRIVVVRTVAGIVEWYIDLPDLAEGNLQPVRPIMPIGPAGPRLPKIGKPAIVEPIQASRS